MEAPKKLSKHSFLTLIASLTMTLLLAAMFCIVFLPRNVSYIVALKSNYKGGDEYVYELGRGEKLGNHLDGAIHREYYVLEGWYTDPLCGAESYFDKNRAITGNITLYAKWTPVQFTLAADTGEGVEYYTYNAEQEPELAVPVREGYLFAGWYLSPECKEEDKVDEKQLARRPLNAALYAKWIPVE